jgi:hypothetical protein
VCHKNGSPGEQYLTVAAGTTIRAKWNAWADSHKGPILSYVAPCNGDCTRAQKTALKFVKIDESGYLGGRRWATDSIVGGGTSSIRIPSSLKPGQYILRHESIALHGARNVDAQFYPQCINLRVTGSGNSFPGNGVPGTRLYQTKEPGLVFDLYTNYTRYPIPGPKLWRG